MRLIPLILAGATLLFGNERLIVTDKTPSRSQRPEHPIERMLSKSERPTQCRGPVRLLVLLVEFQTDTDTTTTGNGHFRMTPTANEPQIGAPPHDQAYYGQLCESIGTYWNAASMGQFTLNYSIYPQSGAYELPQLMSYYNPAGASSDLMLQRFIEYFQDVLRVADADSTLHYADFDQIMVIHAGSDWQHDVNGDTPSDMPSFHIHVAPDKTVTVDGGIMIDNFANVPETISQDASTTVSGGINYVTGYGVTNAVMAHEFGHNLGLVDLYSSTDNRPAVGYWDIMDSGGSVSLALPADTDGDGFLDTAYYIEGAIPALPSAWSRQLLWEEPFRALGYLKDITQLDLSKPVELLTAGELVDPGANQAYMIRVPLNDHEYLLLENRQLDHDRDGMTTLVGDNGADSRVVLYPAGNDNVDPDEYDFVLPGWSDLNGVSYGGGLVVWHVDDDVIYGPSDTDASETNFEANTVNTLHTHRGVSMIEADGMDDIGNLYSLLWTGTAYEAFFPHQPDLDADGLFIGWGIEPFADSLSAATVPALTTYDGDTIPYCIHDIDGPGFQRPFEWAPNKISFRFDTGFFTINSTVMLSQTGGVHLLGRPALRDPNMSGLVSETAVITGDGMDLVQHLHSSDADSWQNAHGAIALDTAPAFPSQGFDWNGDGDQETILTCGRNLLVWNGAEYLDGIVCPDEITAEPLLFRRSDGKRMVALSGGSSLFLYIEGEASPRTINLPDAHIAEYDDILAASTDDRLNLFSIAPGEECNLIATYSGNFAGESRSEPVVLRSPSRKAVFLPTLAGDVWRFDGRAAKIFTAPRDFITRPSQLALGQLDPDGAAEIVFALGSMIYAIDSEGSLAKGFPVCLITDRVAAWCQPRILRIDGETVILFTNERGGSIAVDGNGNLRPEYALAFLGAGNDQLFYESSTKQLCYLYCETNPDSTSTILAAQRNEAENPLIWSGFRNGSTGVCDGPSESSLDTDRFDAYAFPSPARDGQVRFRVFGANSTIEVSVYDIAGNLVFHKEVSREPGEFQDNIIWNTAKAASGAYFGVVKSGSRSKTIRIGVEN
jgi:M6 family metalloprotease-like protein